MLDEMKALVALDEAGSFVRAADKMCLTPSAATRMVQRLETHLGATLLDRTVKPPRFTPLGRNVLQQCRDVLARVEDIAASASAGAEPRGVFRLGLAHAVADETVVAPARKLRDRFRALKLRLFSDLTSSLVDRLHAGELDAAVVLLPLEHQPPRQLLASQLSRDTMTVTAAKSWRVPRNLSLNHLRGQPWVLNPTGCLLRAALVQALQRENIDVNTVAEVHNLQLQSSLVASGHGLGLLPLRHVRSPRRRAELKAVRPGGLEFPMQVAFVRAGHLGRQEAAARYLEELLHQALNSAPG